MLIKLSFCQLPVITLQETAAQAFMKSGRYVWDNLTFKSRLYEYTKINFGGALGGHFKQMGNCPPLHLKLKRTSPQHHQLVEAWHNNANKNR